MKDQIEKKLSDAVFEAGYEKPKNLELSTPPKSEMGDFASNVALTLAKKAGENPTAIAEKIKVHLSKSKVVEKIEIVKPGFINIFINQDIYFTELEKILKDKEDYGKSGIGKGKKIQVEYISANPTGPLHIGNARGGPIGQASANLFSFLGYEVNREFYINDIGGQIDRFAESLYYWYEKKFDSKIEFPEGGYPGDYIKETSEKIQKEKAKELADLKGKPEILELFKKEGLYYMVKKIREDAELLGIHFDSWVNQSDFQYSGKSENIIGQLESKGFTTKKEGALWFKNPDDTELKDKESVLIKSDGKTMTYFSDDIAYHIDKFERGFDLIIDIWGANHSGHIARMKAALSALGYPADKLQIILYQYVRLKDKGKVVSMGKRLGNFITIPDILNKGVKPDAFKYFILSQNPNTPFDFDLSLAADTSKKNPVFYIKYAHARICSILEKAGEEVAEISKLTDFTLLSDPKEQALYKEIIKFPEILSEISQDFQIQSLPHFTYKIASLFHDFYTNCQVLGKDKKLSATRLSLILATKFVLFNCLSICDIEAPEKM